MSGGKSYAKGIAKREEILRTALEVIARDGYERASVRQLAEAVGLTNAGLLHYFDSKEHLFAEILRLRDEVDSERVDGEDDDPLAGLVSIVRHNADVPGLIELYSRLSAEAVDRQHGAHTFFEDRYKRLRMTVAAAVRQYQADGRIRSDIDPDRLARLVVAVSDGLQTQWLLNPDFDMAAEIAYLIELA
jgi:AcrR family transcriptional regulator